MKNNKMLIGLAGTIAIFFFEIIKWKLSTFFENPHGDENFIWKMLLLAAGTFSIYVASFTIFDLLDNRIFWRVYCPVLSGEWGLKLKNLEDGSEREGNVTIIQTRDSVLITALNWKDGEYFSRWKSVEAILKNSELFFTYEVLSSKDKTIVKRGYMEFSIMSRTPSELMGNYFDIAPSNARGPIILARKS